MRTLTALFATIIIAVVFSIPATRAFAAQQVAVSWKYNLTMNPDVDHFEVQPSEAPAPIIVPIDNVEVSGDNSNATITYTAPCDQESILCNTAPATITVTVVDKAGHRSKPFTTPIDLAPAKVDSVTIQIIDE